MNYEELFIELIQVALGHRKMFRHKPTPDEWNHVFLMAQQQAIVSFLFGALDGLGNNGQKPPTGILFEWIGLAEKIQSANKKNESEMCRTNEKVSKYWLAFLYSEGAGKRNEIS